LLQKKYILLQKEYVLLQKRIFPLKLWLSCLVEYGSENGWTHERE
jgi:hypothetical protein